MDEVRLKEEIIKEMAEQGTVVGTISSGDDVTESRKVNKELKKEIQKLKSELSRYKTV
jgi:signal transduction histidine kinase